MGINTILDETIALLKALVGIPSLSGQEELVSNYLQTYLQSYFPSQVQRLGNNLIVDCPGISDGNTLLLCSHIDTVAPAQGWVRDPFGAEVEGDKIYGLGSSDAGASVVSLIAALRLLGTLRYGRIILCLAAEEEAGNQGFTKIEPELPRYDAAIFGEPTNLGVATSMRGNMQVVMRSRGVSCHSSRPWQGRNACDQFVKDLQTIRSLDLKDQSSWGGATIEPTIVSGGKSVNQIPDLVETTLDIRTTPDKNNSWVEAELKKNGMDFTIVFNRRHPMHSDSDSPLLKAIQRACPGISSYVFNGTCDMAYTKAPSVVLGPGSSERSHAADEFITISEIKEAIDTYSAILKEYTAVHKVDAVVESTTH